jgi:predicted dehydrogenase
MLIPVLKASQRHVLTTVASRTQERASAYASQWAIPRAVAPYQALIEDSSIDIVYISLPNSLHAEWTIRALDAGKHVLCEKPLALTVADVDAVADAAIRNGRVAAEGFMYRHHPLTREAVAAVRSGDIGTPRLIRGAFTFTIGGGDIRLVAALGGGSLWDVGCYPVSYACLIADGAPDEVFGAERTNEDGIDLTFAGMLRFGGGPLAQFDCGFEAPFRAEMEIVGSEATLRIERPFKTAPESRLLFVRGDEVRLLPFAPEPPYVGEVEDIAAAALDGTPPLVSLAESRRTVRTLCALYESARTGHPVTLRAPSAAASERSGA